MQDNSLESSSSLSQLRESYLPESRVHPRHCEINLSDGGQQHRRYGTVTGKSEDLGAQDEFPDLSAFLSQEELDKSVNLARQAIGQGPQEEKGEEKPLSVHSWKIPASSEKKEVSQTQPMTPDRQTFQTSSKENNIMRNNRTQKDPGQDVRKPVRNTPYGPEAQSKKEFLNKAADFIEELSSLFKANSSKRIRPRACKTHRSRYQAKAQSDVAAFAVSTEGRERPTYNEQLALQTGPHLEEAAESPSPHGPKGDLCDAGQPESCETTDASPSAPPPAERCVVEPPRFLRKLKSREVPEGSKVQLDCVVRGCPTPEVRWFCEGKELESSPDILIVSDGELHSLTITEAFEEDTGRYSCFASNFYGTDSTSAEIYIEGASSTDSDGDQHCEHVAQPQKKPSTSVPVVPRPPPVCEEDPPSVSPSTAPPITVQDVSSPPAAQMVNPQTLLQEDQNAVNCPQGLDGRLLMAAPVFTKNLQDITATEGQLVVLECRVKGVPSPRVEWYREGSMVDDSPDFRILQKKPRSMAESEEICTLVIAEVFPEDSGMFTCTAKNKYGTQSSIAYLRVKGHEDNSSTTKAVTSLLAESSQHVQIDPKSPDPSSRMVLGHMTQSNSSPGDGLTFNAKPFHQSEPHPGNTITEPLASSLKSKLEDFHVLYNKPLPKLEDINVSHKKPLPQLEDVNVGHNQPFPWLEGSHAHHNEPLPRAEGGFLHHHNSRPNYFSPDTFSQEALAKPSDPFSSSLPPSSVTLGLRPKPEGPKPEGPKLEGPQASPVAPRLSTVSRDPGVPPKAKAQAQGAPSEQGEARPAPSASDTPSSCLKPRLVNQSEARTNSRVGLRVHFKLPEDELESTSLEDAGATVETWEDPALTAPRKEPPAVLAKPRLDPDQLQFLHNQVLLEQQQESSPPTEPEPVPWSPPLRHVPCLAPVNVPVTLSAVNMAQGFSYTRPKEFIAAQAMSPTRSLSPTESPVPMLNALATQIQLKSVADSAVPPFSPISNQHASSPRLFPTRVLQSPTSPPHFVSSPVFKSPTLLNCPPTIRPQSPPQVSSPISSSSTPSPIQDPVAFLSSVLPSLPTSPPTNEMGLPRSAPVLSPQGLARKVAKPPHPVSDDDIRDDRERILNDLEKMLRSREQYGHKGQQRLTYEAKARLLGPNNPTAVINYDEEYKVSSFEQRLMSEIEFRLERTPVEESDDEVQHDEIPTGKCIAPIFDKKLKNFRAMEGVPITFACKVVGIPVPKVYWFKDGKQILKKNEHYKRARERDGTCTLHIEAVTSDDDGNYTVMAANPQGRSSCSGHLIVQTGPVRRRLTPMIHSQRVRSRTQEAEGGEPIQERFFQPHFLQAPGDMAAHEGKLCRLDCKVSGLPNPELMWLRNGRPILADLRHRMLVRENGIHSLLIDPLTKSDAGTYTCIATNKAGQNSFSLELTVMEKEVRKVPMFLERFQNMGVAEGMPVRLECRVVGMPPPVIYWKKDNDSIPPSRERMSMHQDATGYVCLLIQPSRKEDAGWYTVSAKNEAGIVSCTARLDIYAQWHQQIPEPMRKARPSGSRYAALAVQGLDVLSAFPNVDNSPILFASSPVEVALESEEL